METFEITLDDINNLILSKHNVDLKSLRTTRATYEQTMLRRCFYQLATQYTKCTRSDIAKYLALHRSTVAFYKKTGDTLSFSSYYSQVYLDLALDLKKSNASTNPIEELYKKLLEVETTMLLEINKLKNELTNLYATCKSIS